MPGTKSKRRPDSKQPSSVTADTLASDQTEEEKRVVRNNLQSLREKICKFKPGDGTDFNVLLAEAKDILPQVRGTEEAMEDSKMFMELCQKVNEILEN